MDANNPTAVSQFVLSLPVVPVDGSLSLPPETDTVGGLVESVDL
jgi:hypothetical protein